MSQRQSLDSMTPVVDFAFTSLRTLTTVREDLTPFGVTEDFHRLSTLNDTTWYGLFDDSAAAFDIYRQLICGIDIGLARHLSPKANSFTVTAGGFVVKITIG